MTSEPLLENRPSARALELARKPLSQLESILRSGVTPDVASLAGWTFRGINTPRCFRLLGIRKFLKGFWRASDGNIWGYNSLVQQNALDASWVERRNANAPPFFAFYRVGPVDRMATDNRYPNAVLLDYGKGGNARFGLAARLRDYLVQVDSGNPDLLLGKGYVAFGQLRLPTFSFFVLERSHLGPMFIERGSR